MESHSSLDEASSFQSRRTISLCDRLTIASPRTISLSAKAARCPMSAWLSRASRRTSLMLRTPSKAISVLRSFPAALNEAAQYVAECDDDEKLAAAQEESEYHKEYTALKEKLDELLRVLTWRRR